MQSSLKETEYGKRKSIAVCYVAVTILLGVHMEKQLFHGSHLLGVGTKIMFLERSLCAGGYLY